MSGGLNYLASLEMIKFPTAASAIIKSHTEDARSYRKPLKDMPSGDGGLGTALVGEKISIAHLNVTVTNLLGEGKSFMATG